ncbi:MAG TPA: hypothetical protein VFN51_00255 [Candidatus Saccharimonadales bacterium]|nr:hypothetical protein [Candidatus Saccharimonadales bacterium]
MATDKDTIYVDIDDEITGIIDKVKVSSGKVVALVLPKRASVFQSIVNMKLLKRAADESKKNLVLITSEAGLLPLAGASGIHVAKTLNNRPEIPSAPPAFIDRDEEFGEDEAPIDASDDLDASQPVGKLAGTGAAADLETLTLNNDDPEADAAEAEAAAGAGAAAAAAKKAPKPKKNSSLKVPNFNRFRLILGILLLLIILAVIGFFVLSSSLAKANITVSTNSQNVPANLNLMLSTDASSVDPSTNTIPAKFVQEQKTYSQQVGTTGQKNEGNEATGTVTMKTQVCAPNLGNQPSVPAGSGVSNNNLTFITQQDAQFQTDPNNPFSNGSCINYVANNVPITAQNGGSNYNVSGNFTVAGQPNITASGNTSGGTDNMVQVVNQADINNAKNKINASNNSGVKQALTSQLTGDGYYAIGATFTSGNPVTTTSANVGDAANSVTVTETVTYGLFGVHRNDLRTLVDSSVDAQINTTKQSILNDGIGTAKFSTNGNSLTPSGGEVSMNDIAIAGAALNTEAVKQEAAGKKAGDIKSAIMTDPNVTNVNVSFSPFWATTAPSNTNKINVIIAKPSSTQTGS